MLFQNLFEFFKKKVHRKTKEIRELKNDLKSKDEKISKLGIENAQMNEKSKLKDKEIEELKKQLKIATNVDIPTKLNLLKISAKKSDLSKSDSKTPDVEFVEWTEFEFKTEKKGAYGPSKNECIRYYIEK